MVWWFEPPENVYLKLVTFKSVGFEHRINLAYKNIKFLLIVFFGCCWCICSKENVQIILIIFVQNVS